MTKSVPMLDLASAFARLSSLNGIVCETTKDGDICLRTPIGLLCALVSENRWEIDLWLTAGEHGDVIYPRSCLQMAIGHKRHAFMFNRESAGCVVSLVSNFVAEFLEECKNRPQELLDCLRELYADMIAASLSDEQHTSANARWDSGDFKGAAEIYARMPSLSALETKRLKMFKSGKL
jgi:hypothetical protein